MINALLSLTQFYELPLAIFVSRRGVYQEKIEAQFPMGRRLPAMLAGAGIAFSEINTREEIWRWSSGELQRVYEHEQHPCVPDEPGGVGRVGVQGRREQSSECESAGVRTRGRRNGGSA